ncbi:MAG: thioredoxin family protein [Candidatus Peribacteraceae bacterium]|jgi:peroxiredoxin
MVLVVDNSRVLKIGSKLPAFELPATDGSTVDSAAIKDPVLAVIFTCNHCPYAQAYEGRILELARELQPKGAFFVLISSNDPADYPEDSFEHMRTHARQKEFPFPYCYDKTQEVAKAYGALCTPHCFVFDAERRLRYKGRVDDNWKEPGKVKKRELHDAMTALLAGKAPPVKQADAIGCSIKWKKGNEPAAKIVPS